MSDECSAQNSAITSDERIRNVLRRQIQKAFDLRYFNRTTLAQESGVNIHQIDAILTRDAGKHRRVAAEDAFCLAYTLGDDAVSSLVGVIAYTARRVDEADGVEPMRIAAKAMSGLSIIAEAAADGRIDHIEAPLCRDAAQQIITILAPLAGDDR